MDKKSKWKLGLYGGFWGASLNRYQYLFGVYLRYPVPNLFKGLARITILIIV